MAADLRHELERRNEELREANEHLVLAAMRASDMAEAATQAEERRRRMEEFLAMLAHELRNPLAPISTATAILDRHTDDNPTISWVKAVLERQVHHLSRLLDDLLDASRVTRGKIVLKREAVLLGDLVEAAVDEARPMISERNHDLTIALPDKPVTLNGDHVRLTQVICNILHNAAKFTPQRGQIELRAELDNDTVAIHVVDNGAGISATALPQVFDLFAQGDESLSRSAGGLGIGLTVVRSIVQLHDGTVRVESKGLGKGSEVIVTLPVTSIGQSPHAPAPQRGALRDTDGGCRIVVIDDNVDATSALAILLELAGHEVEVAFDGDEGLATVLRERPDLVICDIGLPGIDGYEVATRIRATLDPPPVLLAMTGYGQGEDHDRSMAAGFVRHLVKPVDPTQLLKLITELTSVASGGST